jgi:hypothetical protein
VRIEYPGYGVLKWHGKDSNVIHAKTDVSYSESAIHTSNQNGASTTKEETTKQRNGKRRQNESAKIRSTHSG